MTTTTPGGGGPVPPSPFTSAELARLHHADLLAAAAEHRRVRALLGDRPTARGGLAGVVAHLAHLTRPRSGHPVPRRRRSSPDRPYRTAAATSGSRARW